MTLRQGLEGTVDHTVNDDDLAPALSSGEVAVLATPRVIAWGEAACMAAVAGHLESGETTVGMRVRVDHVWPSGVGANVQTKATLTRIEGRRLTFDVTSTDGINEIALGQIVRVVVETERFLKRISYQPSR